ncbi:hypothetical protein OAL58_03660 [Verrucomicrobia bacterium]|nr:hypothetical protein [Verrucomicrobiota bacterium]
MRANQSTIPDSPPEDWHEAVFKFSSLMAISTGYNDEFMASVCPDEGKTEYDKYASLYNQSMWHWVCGELPPSIAQWAFDDAAGAPVWTSIRRLEYIISRQNLISWWTIRSRMPSKDEVLEQSATQLIGALDWLIIAAKEVNDREIFKFLVKPRTQGRMVKRPMEVHHYLRAYWLSWVLWERSHSERTAIINRRSGLKVKAATVRLAVKKLGFLP